MSVDHKTHSLFGKTVHLDCNEVDGHIRMSPRTWVDIAEQVSELLPTVLSQSNSDSEDSNAAK